MNLSYSNLKQSYKELEKSYTNISEIFGEITDVKDQISSNAYWVGEAANNYIEKLESLISSFDEITFELQSSLTYLNNILERYEVLERNMIKIGLSTK